MDITACRTVLYKEITGIICFGMFRNQGHQQIDFQEIFMNKSGLPRVPVGVIVSANAEWEAVREILPRRETRKYPYGEWFPDTVRIESEDIDVVFMHGGWGKISAAASAQYLIDHANPELIVNLGTCGGFKGEIERGTIVLVERVVVYDIIEAMADFDDHIAHYTTELDLSWLRSPYPQKVTRTLLVSGDRDLRPEDIHELKDRYKAVAGDWESGSIAWVAERNDVRCLILRGVTDLIGDDGGEAYNGMIDVYRANSRKIIESLLAHLPDWIRYHVESKSRNK